MLPWRFHREHIVTDGEGNSMDHIKRRDEELPYISDEKVFEEQKRARRLTQELNTVDRADFEKIAGNPFLRKILSFIIDLSEN